MAGGPDISDERDDETGPLRRCVATAATAPKESLIRFVVGPDGSLVPDLDHKLPGRGLYLMPTRAAVALALKKRCFARSAHRPVEVMADLAERLEALIADRAIGLIGLARRGGKVVMGYDQVEAKLKLGWAGLLLQAADAAEGGRARLKAVGTGVPEIAVLTAAELATPFGRDHIVHVAIARGAIANRLKNELARLQGFRADVSEWEVAEA